MGATNTQLKAIETVHNGYRFRSRLEARWAVFFETLGLEYVYEMEGFDLGSLGWYLPDFWFPQIEAFGEVKPKMLSEVEYNKAAALPLSCLLFDTPEPRATWHYPAGLREGPPCSESGEQPGTAYADYLAQVPYWFVLLDQSRHKKRLWFTFGIPEEFEFFEERLAETAAKQARFGT